MFTEIVIGEKSYKLRLTTKASVTLEKALGYNPIAMLMEIDNGTMPKLGDLLVMLQVMLQTYHHGYTLDKVYELFDEYVEDGHGMFDLIPVFVEVFQQSGYLAAGGNKDNEGETEKN